MPGPNTPDNSRDIPEDSPADSPFARSHAHHANEPAATAPADPARAPDPGSRTTMLLAILAALALFVTTAVLQNRSPDETGDADATTANEMVDEAAGNAANKAADGESNPPADSALESVLESVVDPTAPAVPDVLPPSADPFSMTAKLTLKLRDIMRTDPNAIPTLDGSAISDADQVRMVIVAAEYNNADAARERITNLREQFAFDHPLQTDLDLLDQIYAPTNEANDTVDAAVPNTNAKTNTGTGGQPVAGAQALTDDQRQRLIDHHGWFGEVALSAGLPDEHPDRVALLAGGVTTAVFLLVVGVGLVAAFLAGLVLLIIGIVMLATGRLKPRMPVPERGGSVYVETFALFVGGFLALKLGSELLAANNIGPAWLSMALQWSLILTIFWPLLRGMSVARWKGTVGLHRGAGVMREIGCGFLAYLAGLPLYALAIVLVLVLQALKTLIMGGDGAPPSNPLLELVANAPLWMILLLLSLATIWAPLVEEIIFRGGLFRTARSYMPFVVAAVGVGVVFAFMHNYGPLLTPPLIALGVVFAFMREWRGSLIAPIFAHFLHNATALTLLLTMVNVLDL